MEDFFEKFEEADNQQKKKYVFDNQGLTRDEKNALLKEIFKRYPYDFDSIAVGVMRSLQGSELERLYRRRFFELTFGKKGGDNDGKTE